MPFFLCKHILNRMLEMRDDHSTGLPFACLATKLCLQFVTDIYSEPRMRVQDPLGTQTLMKSNASCGMKVKTKLLSLLEFSLSYLPVLPLLRLLLLLYIMMLDLLKFWLHWALFRGMSTLFSRKLALSVLELSNASLISKTISCTIILLMIMRIDWLFTHFFRCFVDLFWDNFYFYSYFGYL